MKHVFNFLLFLAFSVGIIGQVRAQNNNSPLLGSPITPANGAQAPVPDNPPNQVTHLIVTTPPAGANAAPVTSETFTYSGAIVNYTVPAGVTSLTIEARGAEGSNSNASTFRPGKGAIITGTIAVTPGQQLKLLVGQQFSATNSNGGGGGTFVTDINNNPLLIAGGGGGSGLIDDPTSKQGQAGRAGGNGANSGGAGGTNGNGGQVGPAVMYVPAGGGGLLTDGGNYASFGYPDVGGKAFVNGGAGGTFSRGGGGPGGFGGGGFGSSSAPDGYSGGGGGGYSGGGGGSSSSSGGVGGGGGSYNADPNGTNSAGANSGSGLVIIKSMPCTFTATLINNGPLSCTMTTVTLTASGGTSYTFTSPNGTVLAGSGNTRTVSSPGTYSLTAINVSGCVSTTSTTVSSNTVVVVATLSAAPSTTLTCAQTSLTLTAGGGDTYRFSPNVVSQSGNKAIINATGVYSVTATNTTSGCFSTTSITISQDISAPMASLASSGTLTCAVTSVTLTASPSGQTYRFSPGAAQIGATNQATVITSGLYSVTVGYANGCTSVASVSVSQDIAAPMVSITASPSLTINLGQSATLTANVSGGTAPFTYGWSTGSTSSSIVVNMSGPYSVTATGANGCSSSTSVTLSVINTAPVATMNASQTATVGMAFAYTVNAFTDAETPNQLTYSASINPANGLSFDPATRIISGTPSMSGVSSVTVTATDPGSLSASTTFTITVSPAFGSGALSVLHQDVSFGQTTTNTILPYLQLVNSGAAPIAYSAITVRYWLTVEGNSPITNFQNYYVQIGGNNVHEQYVPLATPRQGATAYVEYRFDAAAGNLVGGTNSGPIQNGFSKGDYSAFNQSDDYSYVANRDYTANARITAYVNGFLVYGQEPSDLGPVTPLSLMLTASPSVLTTSGTTTLSATVSGGTTPYSYSFTGPGTISPSGNTASVSGIPAGVQTFTVVVRDATSPTSQTISGTVSVTVTQANTAPVATANASQTATVGVPFSYLVNAFTDAETPNGLTYTASINPANGFSFDPATRIISGTPSMSGVSSVTIKATDPGSLSASTTFTITVNPAPVAGNTQLTVLHQDVSFGQTTTNTILPYLQLANSGSAPIPYSAITVRYWLTVEGNSPITNFQNYYVQIGGNNVHEQYVPLATPRQGATAYVEYRFDAAAGSLAGGTNSGPIQNGFSKGDYSAFNQSDDYSYVANRDYTANTRITAYVNGVLVYGQEPPVGARIGATESKETLGVQVLGNPLVHEVVEVTVSGAGGQSLLYQLTDARGHLVGEQRVNQAGSLDYQRLSVVGQPAGILLLRVSTPTQHQTVKVLKGE